MFYLKSKQNICIKNEKHQFHVFSSLSIDRLVSNPMKNILAKIIICTIALFQLTSCKKAIDNLINKEQPSNSYIHHVIKAGSHSSNNSAIKSGEFTQLNFVVKFDSSAVYSTVDPANQYDINKLYGFADNNSHHHQFSARVGWRWSDGALRLFAYNYNDGIVDYREITQINIGTEVNCSIKADGSQYIFIVNGHSVSMPRTSKAATAIGYRLYPYFGGNETAPHDIHIWIKEK